MGNIQIKNVPEEIHEKLRERARRQGITVKDYLLDLIRQDQERISMDEWLDRVETREPIDLGGPIHELINQDRRERSKQLWGEADE